MLTGQIYDKASELPLDELILKFNELFDDVITNKQIKTYNTLADLGLDNATATLEDIVFALPSYSMIQLDVYIDTHLKLDIPKSGLLQIIRAGTSVKKAHIMFRNEDIVLYRMYNENHVAQPLMNWRADGFASMRVSAESWDNQLSNINIYGVHYYFSKAEVTKLLDTPSDLNRNAFSIVTNRFSDSDQSEQILVENTSAARQWRRIVHGKVAYDWTRSIRASGDTMTGVLTSTSFNAVKDGESAVGYALQNSKRRASLQISSAGNVGIFDDTLGRWIFRSNNDGITYLGYSPNDESNSNELATTGWVRKRIKVLTGTIAHGGTIPLPSGFTEEQCKWIVSMKQDNPDGKKWDIEESGSHLHYHYECYTSGREVIARTWIHPAWITGVANYLVIGIK